MVKTSVEGTPGTQPVTTEKSSTVKITTVAGETITDTTVIEAKPDGMLFRNIL